MDTDVPPITDCDLDVSVPPPVYLGLSSFRFRVDRYVSEIKLLFYHLPTLSQAFVWPTGLSSIQERIKGHLDQWLLEVSELALPEMDEDVLQLKPEKLKLELLYHAAVTLLFQPSQMFRSPTHYALSLCYQSSRQRLRIYNHLSNGEMLYYSWRNIHSIFSSGATILYCLWASPDLQSRVPFTEALRYLRTCSNLLSVGSQWWPSVRNGKESFDNVVDLTIRHLSHRQDLSRSSALPRNDHSTVSGLNGQSDPTGLSNAASTDAIDLETAYDATTLARPIQPLNFQSANNPATICKSPSAVCPDCSFEALLSMIHFCLMFRSSTNSEPVRTVF